MSFRPVFRSTAVLVASLLWFAGSAAAAETDGQVSITYEQPESFTDFRGDGINQHKERQRMMESLDRALNRSAAQYLGPERRLAVVFTDIDLAGQQVPTASASRHQIREVRPAFVPEIHLRYRVSDSAGDVLVEDETVLRPNGFQWLESRARQYRSESLPYEKALLDHWLRDLAETLP